MDKCFNQRSRFSGPNCLLERQQGHDQSGWKVNEAKHGVRVEAQGYLHPRGQVVQVGVPSKLASHLGLGRVKVA